MFSWFPWGKGDKNTASLIFLISWMSSLRCWTTSLSDGFGTLTAEGHTEGICEAEGLVTAFSPNSCMYFSQLWKPDYLFFYIWWLSLNFKYLVIRSIGRSVCALRLQIKSLFCEHFCCAKSNALTVQWKCFPQTCEINLFIGRNQNKPLWSGNIIVPFGVYFDEAYNTIPVNHLFKS